MMLYGAFSKLQFEEILFNKIQKHKTQRFHEFLKTKSQQFSTNIIPERCESSPPKK